MTMPKNHYGGGPGTGSTLPPYYRPTPSMVSRNNYFPMSEELGPDEMRISFMGTSPWPPRRDRIRGAAWCMRPGLNLLRRANRMVVWDS